MREFPKVSRNFSFVGMSGMQRWNYDGNVDDVRILVWFPQELKSQKPNLRRTGFADVFFLLWFCIDLWLLFLSSYWEADLLELFTKHKSEEIRIIQHLFFVHKGPYSNTYMEKIAVPQNTRIPIEYLPFTARFIMIQVKCQSWGIFPHLSKILTLNFEKEWFVMWSKNVKYLSKVYP